MTKRRGSGLGFYLILLIVILLSSLFMTKNIGRQESTLSSILAEVAAGKAESAVLNGNKLEVTLKPEKGRQVRTYSRSVHTMMIPEVSKVLLDAAESGKLSSFDYKQPPDLNSIFNVVLILMMVGGMAFFVWFTFSRGGGEGKTAINFGRSRAKLSDPEKNPTRFDDVAGAEEEKEELKEIVDFLKKPDKYKSMGAKIPKGILLVGAPGTGKTLLARAVAGEAEVPFFSVSGSDFVEMFVGVGASRVRDLFEESKKKAPCIIFVDEIDAVGRHRGAGLGGGHDEREQTLNQLLVEMDGFGPNDGVIVMAATNRPDILDPALLRPGRFDRRIRVMRPDLNGRYEILKVHAKDKLVAKDVDLKEIAKITPGFTGADLANLLNEAALLAARKNAEKITYSDISEAVFKVTIGPEKKSRIISEDERRRTAYHESGHAIVLRVVSRTDRVERVSIIPAGGAGGYTAHKPHEDMYFQTKRDLINQIMVALGGRAAEELTQEEVSTGASSDLQNCNAVAREMVTKYGMSEKLGAFVMTEDDEVFVGLEYGHRHKYSESMAAIIDQEVSDILEDAYEKTLQVLRDNFTLLEALAKRLLEKEKIEGPEFEELYKEYCADFKPAPGEEKVFLSELVEKEEKAASETSDASDSAKDSTTDSNSDSATDSKKEKEAAAAKDDGGEKA